MCHRTGNNSCNWSCCQEPANTYVPIKLYGEGRKLTNLSNRQLPKKPSKLRFFLAYPLVALGYLGLGVMVISMKTVEWVFATIDRIKER